MKNRAKKIAQDTSKDQPVAGIFFNVMGSIRQPLLVLDSNLKVLKANHSFYQTFDLRPEETEGQLIDDLDNQKWDIPRLSSLLHGVVTGNSEINNFEVEHDFASIGRKIMHFSARRITRDPGQVDLLLLSIKDVTEREEQKSVLEALVHKRTAELDSRTVELDLARAEAEERKTTAEAAVAEISELKEQLLSEKAYLQEEIKLENNHEKIIGQSDALKDVLYKVEQIASSNTTVLVLGETGTGKELIARAVHNLSLRKNRALIKVNCATLPANLIESELFGHEKGSFTGSQSRHLGRFEIANGATLFLDEIGELPLELQAKLLRVLQDGEFERLGSSHTIKVDVRIIAATNRNLEEEVRKGTFREDLWYRLNIFPITMPPLRDRLDDVPLLVAFYINRIAKRMGKHIDFIPENIMDTLKGYYWPGNIRELANVLERAVINSSGPKLRLVDDLRKPAKAVSTRFKTMEEVERDHILEVLALTKWKVSGKGSASEILDLDRSTLRARMSKLHIENPDSRSTSARNSTVTTITTKNGLVT
ncbi:sigma 54-interacting transcriptional regulator [Desulfocastanea catecholica]